MWRQTLFFCIVIVLGAGVFAVVRHDTGLGRSPENEEMKAMAGFQSRIGGVGLGAIVVPAWNFSDYDPRLQPIAADTLYPLPGGYSYSPDRLAMVSRFQVLRGRKQKAGER